MNLRKLIVNADDFGLDDHTVEWTIRGFENGVLTSATIMAGMPATEKAVAYAKAHPQYSFGVHFYLVDEKPMCNPDEIPSMIDSRTGRLWSTRQFIIRNFLGLVEVEDIKKEMRKQYLALLNAGVPISHVDGHGHNHRLPQSIKALKALQDELGIGKVRRCQNVKVGRNGFLGTIINGPMQGRLAKSGFCMTDGFAMNAGHSDNPMWFSTLLQCWCNDDFDGVQTLEIGLHPGSDEEWRKIDTEDCFAHCRSVCQAHGVMLMTYKEL